MVERKEHDDVAVIDEYGRTLTYERLMDYVDEYKNEIMQRQIVLILTGNNLASLICYISCIKHKVVPLLLRIDIDSDSMNRYIEDYNIKYIFVPDERIYNPEGLRENKSLILEDEYICRFKQFRYSLFDTGKVTKNVNDELALLLPTSGSTGKSKLVRISYKNLESNTKSISEYLGIKEDDMAITSLPVNYTYGLSVVNTHLYKRATILLTEKAPYEKEFWTLFRQYKATSFAAVPYTYEILKKMGFSSWSLESLRTMTVAGGKIGSEEEKYFTEYALDNNKNFFIMYGQTEATARISYRPIEMLSKKSGSIGIPIPGGKMWIEDEKGNVINDRLQSGEIVYSGDNVTMGYARKEEDLIKGYEWKNILHTKDIGYMDKDGYFYINGRKDRMVKLSGIRINLIELEKMLDNRFPCYRFGCEMEKCMDTAISSRIRIILKECDDGDTKELVGKEVKEYLERSMGINKRYFKVNI